jgi:uncharacterized membrane protein
MYELRYLWVQRRYREAAHLAWLLLRWQFTNRDDFWYATLGVVSIIMVIGTVALAQANAQHDSIGMLLFSSTLVCAAMLVVGLIKG